MPYLGNSFRTRVQCNLGFGSENFTIEATEVFETGKSNASKRSNVLYTWDSGSRRYITDYILGERIEINDGLACKATPLSTSEGRFIFNGEDKGSHPFTASAFLKLTETLKDGIYLGKYKFRGINTDVWTFCYKWKNSDAMFNITMYWTDPDNWLPATEFLDDIKHANKSVPVTITVNGKGTFGGTKKHIKHEYDFVAFENVEPSTSEFDIPENTYCSNLQRKVEKVPLPNKFSYSSEVVKNYLIESTISYQKHYYDGEIGITRLDFKPYTDSSSSSQLAQTGVTTRIDDFTAGLSITYDSFTGSCNITAIPFDLLDVIVVNNNKVKISSPSTFMGINKDVKFRFYRRTHYREIETLVYVGLHNNSNSNNKGTVIELWIAASTDKTEGEKKWVQNQPLRYLVYDEKDPTSSNRVDINIFHFDSDRPDINLYDISMCIDENEKQEYYFKIDGNIKDYLKTNRTLMKTYTLLSILVSSGLYPIQISGIDFDNRGDNTIVKFTLLNLPVKGDSVNSTPKKTIDDGIASMLDFLSNKKIEIASPDGSVFYKVIPGTLNSASMVQKRMGYSSGAMGGLAFAMLLLGVLIGAGVIYLLKSKNILNLSFKGTFSGFQHQEFRNE